MKKQKSITRRTFLQTAASGIALANSQNVFSAVPAQFDSFPKVAIERCRRYDFEIIKAKLAKMFDAIGGVEALVKNKTLSVKVNLTSYRARGIYSLEAVETIYTHPIVALAACSLFDDFGAKRQIIVESITTNDDDKVAFNNNWKYGPHQDIIHLFESMVPTIVWENTRNKGSASRYYTLPVGDDAYVYRSFDLNHCYNDTDVMVSIAKLKNHDIAGITLSMKNMFGVTPNAIYADPGNEYATSSRGLLHTGNQRPAAEGEIMPVVERNNPGYRVPRIVVDICRARPIDLAIIDGIVSMSGGEGYWNGPQLGITVPNLLIAGKNPVCTDAVAASAMGYDPQAQDYHKPFMNGANTLRLANERGMGSNNLDDIEVLGLGVGEARYTYLPGKRK